MKDDDLRFGGLARLYGDGGLQRLLRASVCVVSKIAAGWLWNARS